MNSDEQVKDIFEFDPERVQKYKVILRRNRLFGFWAGEQLGKLDCEMLDYMASVVQSDLEEPGDLDILQKAHGDLLAFGKMVSEGDLRAKLAELHEQARHEMGGYYAARTSSSRCNSPVLSASSCLSVVASMS